MKLIATLFCSLALALTAFATGNVGTDIPQSGTITFTTAVGVYYTNTFSYPYSTTPILLTSLVTTNAYPVTNISVTPSNFIVSANTTNSMIRWNAYIGYERLQRGTNAVQSFLLLTNVFNPPYAFTPVVNINGSITNSVVNGLPAISSVTPTQFVVQFGNTNQVIYWTAEGTAYVPGQNIVTY